MFLRSCCSRVGYFYTPGAKTKLCYEGFLLKKVYLMWYIISCQHCCLIPKGKMASFCITLHSAIFWNVKHLSFGKVNAFQQILLCLSLSAMIWEGFHVFATWNHIELKLAQKSVSLVAFFFSNILFITSIYLPPQIKSGKKETKDI